MDPAGYVYLGRAVLELGAAIFGDRWVGDEPRAKLIALPNKQAPAPLILPVEIRSAKEYRDALHAITIHASFIDLAPPEPSAEPLNAFVPRKPSMSSAQWASVRKGVMEAAAVLRQEILSAIEGATADAKTQNSAAQQKIDRFMAVAHEIVKACEGGVLRAAHRLPHGGAMVSMDPELWNTERWSPRFAYGAFDLKSPFSLDAPEGDPRLIFFDHEGIDALIYRLGNPSPRIEGLPHLSPYMKLMLTVAEKAGVTAEFQPPKSSLEAEIESHWPSVCPRSDKLVSAMATLIREPKSQLGRAAPRPQKPI